MPHKYNNTPIKIIIPISEKTIYTKQSKCYDELPLTVNLK